MYVSIRSECLNTVKIIRRFRDNPFISAVDFSKADDRKVTGEGLKDQVKDFSWGGR